MRHFAIRGAHSGLSAGIKSLVRAHSASGGAHKPLPSLRDVRDVADFVLDAAAANAASDTEDEASRPVPVPQGLAAAAAPSEATADVRRSVKLSEVRWKRSGWG